MSVAVRFSPQAQQTWDSLVELREYYLLERLDEALDWIENGDRRSRVNQLQSPAVLPDGSAWVIPVRARGVTWAVVWNVTGEDEATVHGIGRTAEF